jgi:hypothetical protein
MAGVPEYDPVEIMLADCSLRACESDDRTKTTGQVSVIRYPPPSLVSQHGCDASGTGCRFQQFLPVQFLTASVFVAPRSRHISPPAPSITNALRASLRALKRVQRRSTCKRVVSGSVAVILKRSKIYWVIEYGSCYGALVPLRSRLVSIAAMAAILEAGVFWIVIPGGADPLLTVWATGRTFV